MSKSLFVSTIYWICHRIGLTHLFLFVNRHSTLHVTYHNIIPDEYWDNSLHLGVSHPASVFKKQITVINRFFHVGTDLDVPGSCRITFDDGFMNQGEIGGSILEKFGLGGVYFVPMRPLEEIGFTLAVDRILQWLSYAPSGSYEISGKTLGIQNTESRQAAFSSLYEAALADPQLWEVLPDLLDTLFPYDGLPIHPEMIRLRFKAMSPEYLHELVNRGHRIACHGWAHIPLSSLNDENLNQEFHQCAALISKYLNCNEFSYPFGGTLEVDMRVLQACRSSPFTFGFLNMDTPKGWKNPGFENYCLPRTMLPSTEIRDHVLLAKLSGLESFFKKMLG